MKTGGKYQNVIKIDIFSFVLYFYAKIYKFGKEF